MDYVGCQTVYFRQVRVTVDTCALWELSSVYARMVLASWRKIALTRSSLELVLARGTSTDLLTRGRERDSECTVR